MICINPSLSNYTIAFWQKNTPERCYFRGENNEAPRFRGAVFVAFLGQVAVYLLRTVESSGLLYAAGGNFNNRDQK